MLSEKKEPDLTLVLPCRDEERAVAFCIQEALEFLKGEELEGEILLVDNGSGDASAEIALRCGARVIREERPGYGSALRAGIKNSRGGVILMGDCDTTYDFTQLGALYCPMSEGKYDVMIGDRFSGGIEKGAMSLSHYFGVKLLSALGRLRFKTDVRDFHCGLRGLTRSAAEQLEFFSDGMEFATEMIAAAARAGLKIGQAPVKLRRCGFERKPKLRTIRDGFRHLRYIIM